ncbi:MAG TPA: D-aminoacylase [Bacteroidales bacterium]|jgi:N-acyl-D-amino-acid deacylase|nr:D-aminoacylase [Bacteroidales bacterium]OQC58576.1 MAG: D-aminoacylase [Bacteroidetes bacterium ADurb.Bin013]MBP8999363.1 D-aminoacylase [Bacteroidales bacterium]MBV6455163.1 D-aminoacylase [Bacteroidales bacterium]MCZ2317050.1 D-aminoacylase [Bacteroidales bacterium]
MKSNISRRSFLKKSILGGTGLVATAGGLSASSIFRASQPFDTIIQNGLICTGDGTAPYRGDVGIKDGRIAALGRLGNYADHLVDVDGMAISPGFVDLHSHTDTNLFQCPRGDSRIFQGITTEAGGNCGDSPFPVKPYENASSFLEALRNQKTGINYCTFTGQGSIRSAIIGEWDRAATAEQQVAMKDLLEAQLEQGSIGLSCGLEYAPGAYASNEELVGLLKVVAKHNGLFSIHMRNEDDRVEEAVSEAIAMARESGVRLQISHLKAQNFNNWHKGPSLIRLIENARRDGIDIAFDRYPYIAFSTGLTSFIPLDGRQGTMEDVLSRLRDKETDLAFGEYARSRFARFGGTRNVIISACSLDHNKETYMGRNLEECARISGQDAWDFVRDLLIEERLQCSIVVFAMTEDNVRLFLAQPLGMPASDGSVYSPRGPLSETRPHPRSYGTFPRFLGKYCREGKLMDFSAAVRKITSLPASRLGLKERGLLVPGYHADVVVFDPATVIDRASFEDPHRFPEGIPHVWVNGVHTIRNGSHTGVLAGMVL